MGPLPPVAEVAPVLLDVESLRAHLQRKLTEHDECNRLLRVADAWKAAALNRLGKCVACNGDGIIVTLIECGDSTAEPCSGCGGTGRGDIAFAFARLQEQVDAESRAAEHSGGILSDVCDAAFGDEDRAATHGYDGIVERVHELVREDEQRARVFLDAVGARDIAVAALAEVVKATGERTDLGQIARRALGLCGGEVTAPRHAVGCACVDCFRRRTRRLPA